MSGVDIKKGQVGANAQGSADSTSALIGNGVAISGKLELDKRYLVANLKMAEALGITAEYDATNKVRMHRHISEFYRMAGEGKQLNIMVVGQDKTMVEMLETAAYAKSLINNADGEVRQLAVCLNPSTGNTETVVDGVNSDVRAAIGKAQGFAEACYNNFRPLQIVLEGRGYAGDAGSIVDLKNIPDTPAPKVTVVIGQDWDYAETQDAIGKKFADVGTALGCIAKVKVNQNIGENETMNITDAGKGAFLTGGLSDHSKIIDCEEDWGLLDTKHFVFPTREIGLSGLRWNNDHTCVTPAVDSDGNVNEHSISLGRTIDKAARLLRAQLLPKVKTVQPLDAKTGKLPVGVVKYFEGLGDSAFQEMEKAREITTGKTVVDPNSDLMSGEKSLDTSFTVVPFGTINTIKGIINLKNRL